MALGVLGALFGSDALPDLGPVAVHGHGHDGVVALVEFAARVYDDAPVEFWFHGAVAVKGNQEGNTCLGIRPRPGEANVALVSGNQSFYHIALEVGIDGSRITRKSKTDNRPFERSKGLGVYIELENVQQWIVLEGIRICSCYCGRLRLGNVVFSIQCGRKINSLRR